MRASFKEKLSIGISVIALALSVTTTAYNEMNKQSERERSLRGELTSILTRDAELQRDMTEVMRDQYLHGRMAAERQVSLGDEHDTQATYYMQVASIIGGESTALLRQAMTIAEEIPELVSSTEYGVIGLWNLRAGDTLTAERYLVRAAALAESDLYRVYHLRNYAIFLFNQRRVDEGRKQYQTALETLVDENDQVHWENGQTYKAWAESEARLYGIGESVNSLMVNARNESSQLSNTFMKGAEQAALQRHYEKLQEIERRLTAGVPSPTTTQFAPNHEILPPREMQTSTLR